MYPGWSMKGSSLMVCLAIITCCYQVASAPVPRPPRNRDRKPTVTAAADNGWPRVEGGTDKSCKTKIKAKGLVTTYATETWMDVITVTETVDSTVYITEYKDVTSEGYPSVAAPSETQPTPAPQTPQEEPAAPEDGEAEAADPPTDEGPPEVQKAEAGGDQPPENVASEGDSHHDVPSETDDRPDNPEPEEAKAEEAPEQSDPAQQPTNMPTTENQEPKDEPAPSPEEASEQNPPPPAEPDEPEENPSPPAEQEETPPEPEDQNEPPPPQEAQTPPPPKEEQPPPPPQEEQAPPPSQEEQAPPPPQEEQAHPPPPEEQQAPPSEEEKPAPEEPKPPEKPADPAPNPAPPSAGALSPGGKKGLNYNDANLLSKFPGIGWVANWEQTNANVPPGVRSYPMLWNAAQQRTDRWQASAEAAIARGDNVLLSFNEPQSDQCANQACMTPDAAVAAWKQFMQPYKEKGAILVSPSITQGPVGEAWLKEFLAKCPPAECKIDAISLHWYEKHFQIEYFEKYFTDARNNPAFGNLPIYVTEWAPTDGDAAQRAAFIKSAVEWMNQQDFIVAYGLWSADDLAAKGMIDAIGAAYAAA